MASSTENPIPTDTFLLSGQAFTIGLPWERATLPKHGLPPAPPKAAKGSVLDQEDELDGDPCTGWEIGRCEVIRRLTPGSARRLLALRHAALDEDAQVVDVRLLDVAEADAPTIEAWASEAARLSHPNLARVFELERTDEGLFWVSERVSGATLLELFDACRQRGSGLPVGFVLAAIHDAALALGEVHSRAAHGLISDQAVAVGFDGITRLLDAGLFNVLAKRRSWAEVIEVTGPYLAPEQVLGGRLPDPKADVYSLGLLLFELLSGQTLRRGRFDDRLKQLERGALAPISSINRMVDKSLDAVLERALSVDRAVRFTNGAEFAQALKKAASSFMWKQEARARFVCEAFETRRRRELALTAHLAPKKRRTAPVMPAIVVAAPVPQAPVAEPRREPPFPLPRPIAVESKKKRARAKVEPTRWPIAAALGLFVGALLSQHQWTPAPARQLSAPARTVKVEAPPALIDGEMTREVVTLASIGPLVIAPAPAPEKKVRPKVKRLAKGGDAPVPPWLVGKRRR